MLRELYSDLVKIHYQVQKHAADGHEREATALLDVILDLEQRIVETPASSLDDAAVKLRLLQMEIFGDISVRQRTMLLEVLNVLRKAAEQAAESGKDLPVHN
jgi:hypothetical protein